jgi:hypothetical protein
MKISKKILAIISICIFSLNSIFISLASDEELERKVVVETIEDIETFIINYQENLKGTYMTTESEMFYMFEDLSYEVISENPVKMEVLRETTTLTEKEPVQEFLSENIRYQIQDVEIIENQIKAEEIVYIKKEFNIEDVPQTIEEQGSIYQLESIEHKTTWIDGESIPIVYENYESNIFDFMGEEVMKTDIPLAGYENILLESVGLEKERTRIKSITWQGQPYNYNGLLYRNALANIEIEEELYIGNYKSIVPAIIETKYIATYNGIEDVENQEILKKEIELTIRYKIDTTMITNNEIVTIAKAMGAIALILAVLLIVVVIYEVSKKRGGKK